MSTQQISRVIFEFQLGLINERVSSSADCRLALLIEAINNCRTSTYLPLPFFYLRRGRH